MLTSLELGSRTINSCGSLAFQSTTSPEETTRSQPFPWALNDPRAMIET